MKKHLDEKDRKILEILKDHADYTTRQIAKKTQLPITTVHHRIKRLKKTKVIRKFTVEIDHAKVDRGLKVYILVSVNLQLLKQKKKTQYSIAKELKQLDFMEKVDIITGGPDMVATIRVKGVPEFDKALLTKIHKIEGIEKTQALIVINET